MMAPQGRAGVYARESHNKGKSQDDQLTECVQDCEGQGWRITERWRDGTSASRFATRSRDDWPKVIAAVNAGSIDVLVLWECSRGSREPVDWFTLLAACRSHGVLIRVTSDERTFDLARAGDWKVLADLGVDAAHESEKTSMRLRRGMAAAARNGTPHARVPYGFRREYDPVTRKFAGQVEDPETAPVVREIIGAVARGTPINVVLGSLNERGVPSPAGGLWRSNSLRHVATRVGYAGLRSHKGQTHPAAWDPIVDVETFWRAQRVLSDPTRTSNGGRATRPGAQRWLLTNIATCGVCGAGMTARPAGKRRAGYKCPLSHVSVAMDDLDRHVAAAVVAFMSRPDAYADLRQAGADDDREALAARAQSETLRARLDEWRRSAAHGETTPSSLAVIEADLSAQIREADSRARRASLPPAVRELLAPAEDVLGRWLALPVPARRTVIRTLFAEITIDRASAFGVKRFEPERVRIQWRAS